MIYSLNKIFFQKSLLPFSHLPCHVPVCLCVCFVIVFDPSPSRFIPQLPPGPRQVEDHISSAQLAPFLPWASQEAGWRGSCPAASAELPQRTVSIAAALSVVLNPSFLRGEQPSLRLALSVMTADGDGGGGSVMLFSCNCVDDMSNTSALYLVFFVFLHVACLSQLHDGGKEHKGEKKKKRRRKDLTGMCDSDRNTAFQGRQVKRVRKCFLLVVCA